MAFSATAHAAAQATVPRVLVREPVGVAADKTEEVELTIAGAVREAGGAAIRAKDFGKLAENRTDVKMILDGAKERVKKGGEDDRAGQSRTACDEIASAIEDYESIGADVWSPHELGAAYAMLGIARAHADQAAKKPAGQNAIDAMKRARSLDPAFDAAAAGFKTGDAILFKRYTGGNPAPPAPPGEGFWSLARVMGLDALVEVRSDEFGVLSVRAHRIKPANVKTAKAASKAPGLDATARKQLTEALGFNPVPNVNVASASPAATPTAVAASATATPKAASTIVASASATPTPKAAATSAPKPSPTATTVASADHSRNGNGNGNGGNTSEDLAARNGGEGPTGPVGPHPPKARANALPGGDSWVEVVGGTDHRAAVYSATDHFVNAASGDGASAKLHLWYALGKAWSIDFEGGGITRAYLLAPNVKKSSTATEIAIHGFHGDDANGMWWVGAGVAYISEPKFILPGASSTSAGTELVPAVTRAVPEVVGEVHFVVMPRVMLRARGRAGAALETTGADFGSGVGFDLAGDGSAVVAVTNRIRFTAGGGVHRISSQYAKKQTEIESRRSAWAGIEAAF